MSKFLGARIFAITFVIAAGIGVVLPIDTVMSLMAEHGPVESSAASMWLMVSVALLVVCLEGNPSLFPFLLLAVLAGARELDGQKAYTSGSITKLNYWLDPAMPWSEKLIVLTILAPVGGVLISSLVRNWRRLRRELAAGNDALRTVLTIFVITSFVMMLDAAPRNIRYTTGEAISPSLQAVLRSIEETCELLLPALALIALGQFVCAKYAPKIVKAVPDER